MSDLLNFQTIFLPWPPIKNTEMRRIAKTQEKIVWRLREESVTLGRPRRNT